MINRDHFLKLGPRIEHAPDFVRLDYFLGKKFPFLSRVKWQKRIKNAEILITSHNCKIGEFKKVKITYHLKKYDQIWYFSPQDTENLQSDQSKNIEVVYDDGDICIFSKPAHMVVHPVGIYGKNNFLTHIQSMGYHDCAPVHRIDRETSGLLVCARQSKTRAKISALFRENKIHKLYFAVTYGNTVVDDYFTISSPIGTPVKSAIRLKMCVNGLNSVPALTEFYLLAKIDNYHLFACVPKTGRTNQIRIHLSSIGQWIVGDKMYHPNENVFLEFYEKGYTNWVHENVLFPRHLLHNAGIFIPGFMKSFVFSKISKDMVAYPVVERLFKDFLR